MVDKAQRGWTLTQVLVGMAIIGILAAVAIPRQGDYIDRAKVMQAVQDISIIGMALDNIRIDQGVLPESLDAIGMGGMRDPWGNPYQYFNIEDARGNGNLRKDRNLVPINTDYDLYSLGPDGQSQSPLTAKASQDDIIRASDGGYVGLASEF